MKGTSFRTVLTVVSCLLIFSCRSIPYPESGSGADDLQSWLESLSARGQFSGYVLAGTSDGVLFRAGIGPGDSDPVPDGTMSYNMGSITKLFTALAIHQCAEDGLLELDDRIAAWFPDLPLAGEITVDMLLSHTSGLPELHGPVEYYLRMEQPRSFEDQYAKIRAGRRRFSPGVRFEYSNSGYFLLGRIVELVGNMSYADYLERSLAPALGTQSLRLEDGVERPDRPVDYRRLSPRPVRGLREHPSVALAAGAAIIRPDDLYSLGLRALRGEVAGFAECTIPRVDVWEGMSYGHGLFTGIVAVASEPRRLWWHSGGYGGTSSMLSIYPDDGLVIVVFATVRSLAHWYLAEEIEARVAGVLLANPVR